MRIPVRYMQLYLEQLSYKVTVAADMESALREIAGSRCDVLISDIGLQGGVSGLMRES